MNDIVEIFKPTEGEDQYFNSTLVRVERVHTRFVFYGFVGTVFEE